MEIDRYIVASDQELVDLALENDNTAFESLFKRYREGIFQLYMQRTGGNREDADDLLQETFIKVFLNLHRYDRNYTFGQWVYTIARNTFIDYIRKRRENFSIGLMQIGHAMMPASTTPNPEEHVINNQQQAQFNHFLARMTPRYRLLIELRFFRELSYEEIAQHLKIPMGTVKTQIHRAREQLCRFIIENTDIMP